MAKFKFKCIVFLFFVLSNLNANSSSPLVRPFDFASWNFERDIEEAYEASYEVIDGLLVNVDDPNKNGKAKQILSKILELEGYYKCLVNLIRDNLFLQVEDEFLRDYGQYFDDDVFTETDNRFKQLIEIPMEDSFGRYRHRVLTFSNKTWIKNPDYTKLFIKLQIKEIEFVENYIKQKLGIALTANGRKGTPVSRYDNNSEDDFDYLERERTYGVVPSYDRSESRFSRSQRPSSESAAANRSSRSQRPSSESAAANRSSRSQRPSSESAAANRSSRSQRSSSDYESRAQQSAPRQPIPRSLQEQDSSKSRVKGVKPTNIRRGNLRPSSTRPSLRRPGSDVRPNFIRPLVRPLGDKPVPYRRNREHDDN
ncbi:hypothetical protein [Borrelia persica]|uniref:hypothetical protein n=1 Tax=Borrelia persica TaxID=44448 RepID=UPI0004B60E86|nr:hypothetical protein [Borrelia persica]